MKITNQQVSRIQLTLGILREMMDPNSLLRKKTLEDFAYDLYELWDGEYDFLNVTSGQLKDLYNTGKEIELKPEGRRFT